MKIVDRPLSAGVTANNPSLIVVHCMAEYVKDPDPVFAADFLEGYGLSAHALVAPDGTVYVCRHPTAGAYHARGYNKNSLGVEFLVAGEHDYSSFVERIKQDWVAPEQYEAGVELVQHWCDLFDINDIKKHSDLSPGRKVDPGTGFNWERFISRIET